MEIIQLRHGKPVALPLTRITANAFSCWVVKYNEVGLDSLSLPDNSVLETAKLSGVIVSSELPRSIQSADRLITHQITFSSALFNEAELPVVGWRIKLSPKLWAVIFRIAWLLGFSKNVESYTESKKRALDAVKQLERQANEHGSVLLVGHGVYNRILANALRANGWSGPANPGRKHWSFGVYRK